MQKVIVMTDTIAGIPGELAKQYGIRVVAAANIIFDGHIYTDSVDINATEAYNLIKLNPDKFSTSAINPGVIIDAYRDASKGTGEILFITVASVLSAINKSVNLAAEAFQSEAPDKRIKVMDSRTAAGAQGLVVLAAARAAAQGMSLDDVSSVAEQTRQKTGGLMLLDTLRYLYRTGRMSKTASRIAAMLHVKPINRIGENGTVEYVTRVRSREDGIKRLTELVKKEAGTNALHFMVMHAADPAFANDVCKTLNKEFKCLSVVVSEYSPVMGYATGPGTVFVGFHPEISVK